MHKKPKYLPQISAPFTFVVDNLENDGVRCKNVTIMPTEITPQEPITFLDSIDFDENKKMDPIWIAGVDDEENVLIDGHHRWVDCLSRNEPIECIKILQKPMNACRFLNKAQDFYDYQTSVNLEEIVTHFQNINDRNDKDSDDWLGVVTNEASEENKKKKNPKKIIGYRDKPINDNSVIGNFFLLEKLKKCDKYEIEFENLLDTNEIGVDYKSNQNPTDILSRIWFPNVNFNDLSEKYKTSTDNLKNKAICEYAKKMGYDGIKYGNIMVQGFN